MPYQRTTDGSEDDLPTYIRRAFGHDRTWMDAAACHPKRRPASTNHATWALMSGETRVIDGVTYHGHEQEQLALDVCLTCPQQWLCARWAHDVQEDAGTWAMPLKHLRWLRRQIDAADIIDHARVQHIPVQVAVSLVRDLRLHGNAVAV